MQIKARTRLFEEQACFPVISLHKIQDTFTAFVSTLSKMIKSQINYFVYHHNLTQFKK